MKLTREQIEDILTLGEAKAAQQNKKLSLYLLDEHPTEEEFEENATIKTLGYIFEFRPYPERVYRGLGSINYDEIEIFDYWQVTRDGEKENPEEGLPIAFTDLIDGGNIIEREYIIKYGDQKYASWEPFSKAYGVTELATFSTKIPRPLAIRLQKICEEQGETPSWRIRTLIQKYLTEQIKERVRNVLFEG